MYHVVEPTTWEGTLPDTDTLVVGSSVYLTVTVRPALYEPEAEILQVVADLRAIGGGAQEPLRNVGDGTYALETIASEVPGPNRATELAVVIDQATSLGPYWVKLPKSVVVAPGVDLAIYDEAAAPGWELSTKRVTEHNLGQTSMVRTGATAWALRTEEQALGWSLT